MRHSLFEHKHRQESRDGWDASLKQCGTARSREDQSDIQQPEVQGDPCHAKEHQGGSEEERETNALPVRERHEQEPCEQEVQDTDRQGTSLLQQRFRHDESSPSHASREDQRQRSSIESHC